MSVSSVCPLERILEAFYRSLPSVLKAYGTLAFTRTTVFRGRGQRAAVCRPLVEVPRCRSTTQEVSDLGCMSTYLGSQRSTAVAGPACGKSTVENDGTESACRLSGSA